MKQYRSIAVIDGSYQERAKLTNALSGGDHHIEPYEGIDEFFASKNVQSLVILRDVDRTVEAFFARMEKEAIWLPVIVYGVGPSVDRVVTVMLQGAIGYLDRIPDQESVSTLFGPESRERQRIIEIQRAKAQARSKIGLLTRREQQVLRCVADGMSNKVIGAKLGISPRTVEIHRANMIGKLETGSTSEAMKIAAFAELYDVND